MNRIELHSLIKNIIGKKVLKVNAGGSTGSIFSLDIGNELVSEFKRGIEFKSGESVIMVYCAWRLVDKNKSMVITGCHENSDLNGSLTLGLNSLLHDIVDNVLLTEFNDLIVVFKSSKVLSMFCDITPGINNDTNWFYGFNKKYYSINNKLQIEYQSPAASARL